RAGGAAVQAEVVRVPGRRGGLQGRGPRQQKIIDGKVSKWLDEVTLLGQDSVTDPGKTVETVRKEVSTKVGGDVKLISFVRFALGEGIEKKSDDLAAEVAKMTAGA
ncbi:MAG: elongation factor Ts, partial [Polyangiaceae bacterium]